MSLAELSCPAFLAVEPVAEAQFHCGAGAVPAEPLEREELSPVLGQGTRGWWPGQVAVVCPEGTEQRPCAGAQGRKQIGSKCRNLLWASIYRCEIIKQHRG